MPDRETQRSKHPGGAKSLRIAVVGGGVAGICAAHALPHIHRVTLFEQNDYVGGHTHTIVIPDGPDAGTPVDTGFIVLNDRTYPVLNGFFRSLGVGIAKSDMSFSYVDQGSGFQYGSRDLNSLFAQRRNLLDAAYLRMLGEIVRFNHRVLRMLQEDRLSGMTLGGFLRRFRFSDRFREQYLFPMVAAIWSAPDLVVHRFPMLTFARFFDNHGLLTLFRQPQWYYVAGGSHSYVKAFRARFQGGIHTERRITSIRRRPDGVVLTDADGHDHLFDRVIIATHADEALGLLADPNALEQRLLGAWRYSVNATYLHTDLRWMPTDRRAWASWNFLRQRRPDRDSPVTLTYHMNRLQRLDARLDYMVTLNPFSPIAPDKIIARMRYTHPVYTARSIATQPRLPELNNGGNTLFCGSYFGYGFHEDAARSGFQAAAQLGGAHAF